MLGQENLMANDILPMPFHQMLVYFYVVWTLCKFLFYIMPMVDLIKIKKYANYRVDVMMCYSLIIPIFEFVAYYYVVTRIIEKILDRERGRRLSGILSCQIYGIAAGILNTLLLITGFHLRASSLNPYAAADIWALLTLNMIIFASWIFLSYLHLRGVFIVRRLLLINRARSA
jgi:hypothetical protein